MVPLKKKCHFCKCFFLSQGLQSCSPLHDTHCLLGIVCLCKNVDMNTPTRQDRKSDHGAVPRNSTPTMATHTHCKCTRGTCPSSHLHPPLMAKETKQMQPSPVSPSRSPKAAPPRQPTPDRRAAAPDPLCPRDAVRAGHAAPPRLSPNGGGLLAGGGQGGDEHARCALLQPANHAGATPADVRVQGRRLRPLR